MTPDPRPQSTGTRPLVLILIVFLIGALYSTGMARQEQDGSFARLQGVRIGTITVQFKEFNEHEKITEWEDTARKVIHLKEGGLFSQALLEDSKRALGLLKKFSNIRTSMLLDRGVVTIYFHLTPYRFIKNIVIRGNSAILESEINSVMTVHAGNVFKPEQLPEQEKMVREKFISEGYINPAVAARAEKSRSDGNYTVYITIHPGAYYSYGNVTLNGNRAVPDIMIRYKLFSEMFRFIESEFINNITALKKHYWNQGYPEVEIKYKLNRDSGTGLVDIDITIQEGPKYKIFFSGNKRFWDITLRKNIMLSEQGNRNDTGARKSAQNIVSLYKKKGYPNARVKLDIKQTREGVRNRKALTFIIDEGLRIEVARLQIDGNASFSEKTITKMIQTAASGIILKKMFDADALNNDILIIKSFYARNGFLDAAINPRVRLNRDRTQASIQIDIFEGARTVVTSVVFKGNHILSDADIRKKIDLAPGWPFQESAVASAENQISSLISTHGYPYVTVKGVTAISNDRSGAAIVFTIDEGKPVRLGTVNFSGNIRTRTSYLKKQMSLKPGDPVSIARILEEYKNISDMELFQSVSLATFGIEEKKERADIYIDVTEKKPLLFSIGGGYNSGKGFYASTGLEDKNFLGRYKSVWIKGEAGETGYSGAAGFTEPRLIGSRASATLSFSIDKLKEFNQSFGTLVYGPTCSMKSTWFDSLTAGLGVSYQERKMLGRLSMEDINDIEKTSQFHLRRILLFTAAASYDRRDSFIRPRKGFVTSLSVDLSVDLTRPKRQILGNEYSDNFIKYQYNLKFYVTPWSRLTFAAQAMLGYIQPYTSTQGIIGDQLFYLGGIGDVRGFKENMLKYDVFNKPVGGRASLAGSMEARIDLGLNFELSGFFDAGRINNTFYDCYRLRMTAGAGLRYMTPVGPIGLLYGFKINRLKGEDLGAMNVSIGYTF